MSESMHFHSKGDKHNFNHLNALIRRVTVSYVRLSLVWMSLFDKCKNILILSIDSIIMQEWYSIFLGENNH